MKARRESGYALLIVMVSLTIMAFVAFRFAERMDALRRGALGFNEYATARANAAGARAATLYYYATRPVQPAGRGETGTQFRADGTVYRLPDGSTVAAQDHRGLLSINVTDRFILQSVLVLDGLDPVKAQAWIDVLDDYIDTDSLKRLNGAEKDDYRQRELAPPRNDWLLTVDELELLPLWRDDPVRTRRLARLFRISSFHLFNPNTAPEAVLNAVFVNAAEAQRELLKSFRKGELLRDGTTATSLTGLQMDRDDYLFFAGNDLRITTWSPGLPRALEYNARLTPAALAGPWILLEQQTAPRPSPRNESNAAPPFPLPLVAGEQSRRLGATAP